MTEHIGENQTSEEYIQLATDIVSAYVGNNTVKSCDLPQLIKSVHESLASLTTTHMPVAASEPAVPIKQSIEEDFLICLEDGKKFKSLKRHLRSKFDMSPEEYRTKWGLPGDYPMVAPGYSRQRSNLAKKMGLGKGS